MPPPVTEPPAAEAVRTAAPDAADRIRSAAEAVRGDLEARAARATGEARDVLAATALMAADPTLVEAAVGLASDGGGRTPERAVWEAAGDVAAQLAALGGYLGERARDVADVRDRIVAHLTGRPAPGVPARAEPYVLVAADLAPADTATLDPALVRALVTEGGGPTSHTAILARSLGIPAVVAAAGALALAEGTVVLVDGGSGVVEADPSPNAVARAAALAGRSRTSTGAGATRDGTPVALLANVGDPSGAAGAAAAGAEGVGLFRTEFCFLDRAAAPSVEEQVARYREVLTAFPGRKVVVRTLDAGADKPLPFLTDAAEPNPALGVRGLRTSARHPEVLADQLRAIAAAADAERADVWVMAPMVATVEEARSFAASCAAHGLANAGVMVEVPSCALMAAEVLAEVAFASIGTNDLTQYAMAADRLLGDLAGLSSSWQPAVLRLVEATCRGGVGNGKPVGVCGEAAADPALATVLVGLGVSSLSMTPRAIPDVAAVLAAVTVDECADLAGLALRAASADEARRVVRERLPVLAELGL